MLETAARDDVASLDQRLDHRLVGVALLALVVDDALAGEARRLRGQRAIFIDRVGNDRADAVLLQHARIRGPDLEVVASVSRCSVNEAGAGIVGDVIAGQKRHGEFIAQRPQRMHAGDIGKILGRDVGDLVVRGDARLLEHLAGEIFRQDQQVAELRPIVRRSIGDLVEAVGDLRRIADGAIARQRPGRGGPDHHRRAVVFLFQFLVAGLAAMREMHREFHPHHVRGVILVFDLGFGERGLFDHRPHHRLAAAIQRAVARELDDLARDLRLGGVAHGRIGMRPVALDAETDEFVALHVQPVLRIGAAFLPEGDHRLRVAEVRLGLALGPIILLLDLPFDRQAVAVPSRHIVGVEAEHLLAAGNDVLQHLVERMADMDVAVGVGRAVMQHELSAPLPRLAQLAVEIVALPALEQGRLALGQAGTHRELRLRQKQGLGIIAFSLGHVGNGLWRAISRRGNRFGVRSSACHMRACV